MGVRGGGEATVLSEAYNYLFLKMRNQHDRQTLRNEVFAGKEFSVPQITVDRGHGRVIFDGVAVEVGEDFMAYARQHPEANFDELMLENPAYKYLVGELEIRLLSQFVRAYKYGRTKVVQLEGPSGEGKTEIARVLTKLLKLNLRERTMNADTNLSKLRGQIRPRRDGKYELYTAGYVAQVEAGGNLFLDNEINTARIYDWLFPEISGRRVKYLGEFAETSDDSIIKRVTINRNNLWLFTVNVEGREDVPPHIAAQLSRFHMAQDIETLPQMIERLFQEKGLSDQSSYITPLFNIHRRLREQRAQGDFESVQAVTRRELIRAVNKFARYLQQGLTAAGAFRRAIEEVYVLMWQKLGDRDEVQDLINGILGPGEKIDAQQALVETLQEGKPVLVFSDATTDLDTVMSAIKKADAHVDLANDVFVNILSPSHHERQLIGGLTVAGRGPTWSETWQKLTGLEAPLDMGLGIILELIQTARLHRDRNIYWLAVNYTHLNPQVAPLLNEFLQTGRLDDLGDLITADIAGDLMNAISDRGGELWRRLREEYLAAAHAAGFPTEITTLTSEQKIAFALWFYSQAPQNLKVVATGSSQERLLLNPAEIDRFLVVNIAEGVSETWIQNYVQQKTTAAGAEKLRARQNQITQAILETYRLYEVESAEEYEHNRFGKADIDAFLQMLNEQPALNEELVKKIAFYTFGMGLRTEYRNALSYAVKATNPQTWIHYDDRGSAGIYLIVDDMVYKTALSSIPSEGTKFLASTKNYVRQLASLLVALNTGRTFILEGDPGGGKTASVEDLAKRVGLDFYKQQMYADIDLGEFLGRLSKKGQKFILTAFDEQGSPALDFLKAYTQGGIFSLDEGAIGVNSQEIISLLVEAAKRKQIDLGDFHPGLKGTILTRSDKFHLAVTQNQAGTTEDREPILYQADTAAHKIWTDNILDVEDALTVIDDYLETGGISEAQAQELRQVKRAAAEIHVALIERHPRKAELSPRQLIMVTERLNDALKLKGDLHRALFEGVMLAYFTGLAEPESKSLWNELSELIQHQFDIYQAEWEEPVHVEKTDTEVRFNGTALPLSSTATNVEPEDIFLIEDFPSQSRAMRAVALGIQQRWPVALLEEDGADAKDLITKFAFATGYELHTLWSHDQMNKMHLLASLLPQFEEGLDEFGVKREKVSRQFEMSLGFVLRHMLTADEMAALSDEEKTRQAQKILFFNLMDVIPERQRVFLNEILTTRHIDLPDEQGRNVRYELPDLVHIVVSAPVEHQFSSPFINRFLQVRVNFLSPAEFSSAVRNRFPLVRAEEREWIYSLAHDVAAADRNEVFGLHYGFTPMDAFKLAMHVQFEKQRDIKAGTFRDNPLYYVMKAGYLLYTMGLEDYDRKIYDEEIWKNKFLKNLGLSAGAADRIMQDMLEMIEAELGRIEYEPYPFQVAVAGMQTGETKILPNGVIVRRIAGGFVVKTPAGNIYTLPDEGLENWQDLYKGMRARRAGDNLAIEWPLIKSIGGVELTREERNRLLSLSEDEVGTREFVRYTQEIRRLVAGLLRGWQRTKNALGQERAARVMLINGETGTAKTTLIRNVAKAGGIPLYTVNAHEDLRVSDMLVGLSFKKGKFEVGIKEFLARMGRIRLPDGEWQRIRIAGEEAPTKQLQLLMIDEATASPKLLEALAPLFRGERKFTVEYAGEVFEIELDNEVMVVLTFNPAEKYSGRESFVRDIIKYGEKFWAPNPLQYHPEVLKDILMEYHRRGITREKQKLEAEISAVQRVALGAVQGAEETPLIAVDPLLRHPPVKNLAEVLIATGQIEEESTEEPPGKEKAGAGTTMRPKAPPTIIDLHYDVDAIKAKAQSFAAEEGYEVFTRDILVGFLLARADRKKDEELEEMVLAAARRLDVNVDVNGRLAGAIKDIIELYDRNRPRKSDLKEKILALRGILVEHGVYAFIQMTGVEDKLFLKLHPRPILNRLPLTDDHLRILGEDPENYIGLNREALGVSDNPLAAGNVLAYFDGERPVYFMQTSMRELQGVPMEEAIRWSAWHELGHMMDQHRLRVRGFHVPKGISWTNLARMVNGANIELWFSENVELEAMLFPMIFSPNAKEYALYELVHLARHHKNKDDYYAQAAKGILNGILKYVWHNEENKITDAFEDAEIDKVVKAIQDMTSADLNRIAAEMYRSPFEYLSTTGKGKYHGRMALNDGVTNEEVVLGVDGAPDVEMEYFDGEDGVQVEKPLGDEGTKFVDDTPNAGEQGEGEGAGQGESELLPQGVKGDIMQLLQISPHLVARWLNIFAGRPKELKIYSDAGDEVEMERIITGDLDPFYTKKIVQALGEFVGGVTLDVSGSVKYNRYHLFEHLQEMTKYYTSLFHYAAVRNKDVEFSVSAISSTYHPLLNSKDSRKRAKVEEALASLLTVGDGGGINTLEVIKGIREKYKGKKGKKHKLEIVLTDGDETSGRGEAHFALLRNEVDKLEKEMGIDIVFVGIQTRDVENYGKRINFDHVPSTEELISMMLRISLEKVRRGKLKNGDLGKILKITEGGKRRTPASTSRKAIQRISIPRMAAAYQAQQTVDAAMMGEAAVQKQKAQAATLENSANKGGIDFDPAKINMEIRKTGKDLTVPSDSQPINLEGINGFTPLIIEIVPVANVPQLLGAAEPLEKPAQLSSLPAGGTPEAGSP